MVGSLFPSALFALIGFVAMFLGASLGLLYVLFRFFTAFRWSLKLQLVLASVIAFVEANGVVRQIMIHTAGSTDFPGAGQGPDGKFYLAGIWGERTEVSAGAYRALRRWEQGVSWSMDVFRWVVLPATLLYTIWYRRLPAVFNLFAEIEYAQQRERAGEGGGSAGVREDPSGQAREPGGGQDCHPLR